MKKTFLLLFFLAQTAFAQVEKGVWLISGSADLTSLKANGNSETQFDFTPKAGYFFTDRLLAGLSVSVGSNRIKESSKNKTTIDTERLLIVSPFARYYLPISPVVYAWAEVSVGFGSFKVTQDDDVFSLSASQFGLGPGISFFLNENIAIEGMLRFSNTGLGGTTTRSKIGIFGGFQIYF